MKTLMHALLGSAILGLLLVSTGPARASDQDPEDIEAVKACLKNFGKHPFNAEKPTFRTMAAKVRVFGIGESSNDEHATEKPELVLIKPNVAVLSKNELNLLNPNGWYCLKGQVAVLGKSESHLACNAKLASNRDGVTVLGGNDHDSGVTVLGSSRLTRVGCTEKKSGTTEAKSSAEKPAATKSE
jgi:hypothetical protein